MTVYVDEPKYKLGNMIMCHMVSIDIEELHLMADKIGVDRKWFQEGSIPHYDICKSKRAKAVKCGAVQVTTRDLVKNFGRLG